MAVKPESSPTPVSVQAAAVDIAARQSHAQHGAAGQESAAALVAKTSRPASLQQRSTAAAVHVAAAGVGERGTARESQSREPRQRGASGEHRGLAREGPSDSTARAQPRAAAQISGARAFHSHGPGTNSQQKTIKASVPVPAPSPFGSTGKTQRSLHPFMSMPSTAGPDCHEGSTRQAAGSSAEKLECIDLLGDQTPRVSHSVHSFHQNGPQAVLGDDTPPARPVAEAQFAENAAVLGTMQAKSAPAPGTARAKSAPLARCDWDDL
mmetsp:Transcript_53325/g.88391  ORF Transcript_53325/g.88391 Transcript_53325/m.88391 type:complete len:266 (+) Transcript_53325:2-799(+)